MNSFIKIIIAQVVILVLAIVGYFLYTSSSFNANTEIRCEGKNLSYPETFTDCVDCHAIKTPEVVDQWYDSKHGVMLIKCGTCHGDPSGKGERAFTPRPDPIEVCAKCHTVVVDRMLQKHKELRDCITCHPFHQNSVHTNDYLSPRAGL